MNRRNFFKAGLLSTLGVTNHAMSNSGSLKFSPSTPNEIAGPFYPITYGKQTPQAGILIHMILTPLQ
jgi:hypothetical protein